MKTVNRQSIVNAISFITLIVGISVIIGWILDIELLKSVFAFGITMKFWTALCFLLSGIILYNLGRPNRKALKLTLATAIVIIMGVSLIGNLAGFSIGLEKFLFSVSDYERFAGVPGYPAIMTCVCFLLFAFAVFCRHLIRKCYLQMLIPGTLMCLIGILALIGYLFNIPELYYYFRTLASYSTGMAVSTSIIFVLLGIGIILSAKNEPNHSVQH